MCKPSARLSAAYTWPSVAFRDVCGRQNTTIFL
jgi:hypothetical protein